MFIPIIGGAFWIMNDSKAIDVGILSFLKSTKKLEHWKPIRKLGAENIIMGIAHIPYQKWFKWVMPLLIILIVLGALLLIPTLSIKMNGF